MHGHTHHSFSKEQHFDRFEKLVKFGYRRMLSSEISEEIKENKRLAVYFKIGPPGFGGQWMFIKNVRKRRTVVITSYRENPTTHDYDDSAPYEWVVMRDIRNNWRENEEKLFSFEIRRSKNRLNISLQYAESFLNIMNHWPECPECGDELYLIFVPNIEHAMMFVCKHRAGFPHKKEPVDIYLTNIAISDESKKFLDFVFHRAFRYKERDVKKGIIRSSKRLTRSLEKVPKPPEQKR